MPAAEGSACGPDMVTKHMFLSVCLIVCLRQLHVAVMGFHAMQSDFGLSSTFKAGLRAQHVLLLLLLSSLSLFLLDNTSGYLSHHRLINIVKAV